MSTAVAFILLLPLAGAVINGMIGLFAPSYRGREGLIGGLATGMIVVPFAIAAYLFATYHGDPTVVSYYTWLAAGDFSVDAAFRVDALSLLMTLIVTGVGGVIHLYSIGYMHGDDGYWRYFAYLNLFIFMMLVLVLGDNLPLLFLGWEGVGLCSYLLIGFWYEDLSNAAAANKAFIVNRIGDFAVLVGMFLLYREVGALDFGTLFESASVLSTGTVTVVLLLMFAGATGKSAQIPLFVWLPDAMAGPTPVSALIHAATMVTSGLYLLARLSPMIIEAAAGAMVIVAVIGALTALMAATIAIAQYDIKRVLAYSTVSQLGYMFLAAGVGAFHVAIFHVFTHAFFKACLFLGSGSVIHGMEHVNEELDDGDEVPTQDMRYMGGLKEYMPATYKTYLIATLAISGIPLFAGFFSKDEILFSAFEAGWNGLGWAYGVWIIGMITAFLTAVYMVRSVILTFHGEPRWPDAESVHPHESPGSMTVPQWVLAGGSLVAGFAGIPAVIQHGEWNWIHHWLVSHGPVVEAHYGHHVPLGIEWLLIGLSTVIAIGGVAFAWNRYTIYQLEYDDFLRGQFLGLYRWWSDKYYWDELYEALFVRPTKFLAKRVCAVFDQRVIDGVVNGVAGLASLTGRGLRLIQTGVVQNYAVAFVLGVVLVLALSLFI